MDLSYYIHPNVPSCEQQELHPPLLLTVSL
jgi:hypothetical protein